MDGNAAITVGGWSCWTDDKDQWWAHEEAKGYGGIMNQLEALLLDRIRDMMARAVQHMEELSVLRDRLKDSEEYGQEAREQYSDLQEEHAEEVGDVCQAERRRIVERVNSLVSYHKKYGIFIKKVEIIAAIEEAMP